MDNDNRTTSFTNLPPLAPRPKPKPIDTNHKNVGSLVGRMFKRTPKDTSSQPPTSSVSSQVIGSSSLSGRSTPQPEKGSLVKKGKPRSESVGSSDDSSTASTSSMPSRSNVTDHSLGSRSFSSRLSTGSDDTSFGPSSPTASLSSISSGSSTDIEASYSSGSRSLTLRRSQTPSTGTRTPTPEPEKGRIIKRSDASADMIAVQKRHISTPTLSRTHTPSKSRTFESGSSSPSATIVFTSVEEEHEPHSASNREVKEVDQPQDNEPLSAGTHEPPSPTTPSSVNSISSNTEYSISLSSKADKLDLSIDSQKKVDNFTDWCDEFMKIGLSIEESFLKRSSKTLAEQLRKQHGSKITSLLNIAKKLGINIYLVTNKFIESIANELHALKYSKSGERIRIKAANIVEYIFHATTLKDTNENNDYKIYLEACAARWGKSPESAIELLASIVDFENAIEVHEIEDSHYLEAVKHFQNLIYNKLKAVGYSAPDKSNITEAAEILHKILSKKLQLADNNENDIKKYKKLQFYNMFFLGTDYAAFQSYLTENIKLADKPTTAAALEKEMITSGNVSKEFLGSRLEHAFADFKAKFPDPDNVHAQYLQTSFIELDQMYREFVDKRFDGQESTLQRELKVHDTRAVEQFPEYLNYQLIQLNVEASRIEKELALAAKSKNFEKLLNFQHQRLEVQKEELRLTQLKNRYHYTPTKAIVEMVRNVTLTNNCSVIAGTFELPGKIKFIARDIDLRERYSTLFFVRKMMKFFQIYDQFPTKLQCHMIKKIEEILSSLDNFDANGAMPQTNVKIKLEKLKQEIQRFLHHKDTKQLVDLFRDLLIKLKDVIASDPQNPNIGKEIESAIKKLQEQSSHRPKDSVFQRLLEDFLKRLDTHGPNTQLANDNLELNTSEERLISLNNRKKVENLDSDQLLDIQKKIEDLSQRIEDLKSKKPLLSTLFKMIEEVDRLLEQYHHFELRTKERDLLKLEAQLVEVMLDDVTTDLDIKREKELTGYREIPYDSEESYEKQAYKKQEKAETELTKILKKWEKAARTI